MTLDTRKRVFLSTFLCYNRLDKKEGARLKTVTIGENDAGQRLDKFLTKTFPNLPQSMLYKAIRKKDIKLGGKRCPINVRLCAGDVLTLYLKDEFLQQAPEQFDFLKAPQKLHILYEDENLLLVDKQPGLIVHPDAHYHFDSLIARIQHYLYAKGEYDPHAEQSFAPALVNRIDRNTGGIVIAAKNAEALRILNQKLKDRELCKEYLCLVHGHLHPQEATLEGFLEKNERQNRVYIHKRPVPGGKTIRTRYRVLQEKRDCSLLEVTLLTGRTHQIRAHMASIGHPLLGDGKYGTNAQNKPFGLRYQALYSYKLRFHFTTDAGCLTYLNGMTVEAKDIWFLPLFAQWP